MRAVQEEEDNMKRWASVGLDGLSDWTSFFFSLFLTDITSSFLAAFFWGNKRGFGKICKLGYVQYF
jgi:hypothetical protein